MVGHFDNAPSWILLLICASVVHFPNEGKEKNAAPKWRNKQLMGAWNLLDYIVWPMWLKHLHTITIENCVDIVEIEALLGTDSR